MTDRLTIMLLSGSGAAITAALWASGELSHWAHRIRRWRKDRARKGLVGE